MKKIFLAFVKRINKLLYPKFDVDNYPGNQLIILKAGFFQKIIGFNRKVPWPVHWTTNVYCPDKIDPGNRTPGLSKFCHLDGRNGIIIGKNVWIGPYVKIISMNHDITNYFNYIKTEPIIIGDNCWIGAGSIILPGVKLANHTVVAAGSVVTKSFLEEDQLIGGVPAKVIKKIPPYKG